MKLYSSVFTAQEWRHYYRQICAAINIDPYQDREHVNQIYARLPPDYDSKGILQQLKSKKSNKAIIFGAAPSLEREFKYITNHYDLSKNHVTTIAADGATTLFRENQLFPDIVISDLDGIIDYRKTIHNWPTCFFIHIHGDNQVLMDEFFPHFDFEKTLFTTQTSSKGQIYNFGGFTDGDRAFAIAIMLDYDKILLSGFQFRNHPGKYSKNENWTQKKLKQKQKKLLIAEKLTLHMIKKSNKTIILSSNSEFDFRRNIDEFFQ